MQMIFGIVSRFCNGIKLQFAIQMILNIRDYPLYAGST